MANEYLTTTNDIEVLGAPPSSAQVTTNSIEVLGSSDSNAQVSSVFIQVLRSVSDAPVSTRRRQMVLS